jgi:hypothetical protein
MYTYIFIVFQDLFCKGKLPQNLSMTSCDVIKLGIGNSHEIWSRAEPVRRTAGASTWQRFLRMCAGGAQGAVRSSRLWVGHCTAGAAGTGDR